MWAQDANTPRHSIAEHPSCRNSNSCRKDPLTLQRHPDQIDGIVADVAGLVSFADVDGRHPADLPVRRGLGVGLFGFVLGAGGPLAAVNVNVKHVRMMRM